MRLLRKRLASLGSEKTPYNTPEEFLEICGVMGLGWSVAVAAHPSIGKPKMEMWIGAGDPDIRWIMKQNLKKKRLSRMDEAWVQAQLEALV